MPAVAPCDGVGGTQFWSDNKIICSSRLAATASLALPGRLHEGAMQISPNPMFFVANDNKNKQQQACLSLSSSLSASLEGSLMDRRARFHIWASFVSLRSPPPTCWEGFPGRCLGRRRTFTINIIILIELPLEGADLGNSRLLCRDSHSARTLANCQLRFGLSRRARISTRHLMAMTALDQTGCR